MQIPQFDGENESVRKLPDPDFQMKQMLGISK